jgi:hypothetical protein
MSPSGCCTSNVKLSAGVWRLSESFQRSYMSERFSFLSPPKRPV